MRKSVKYILLGLLLAFLVACCVFYCVCKNEFIECINLVWDLLNKPLPIISMTTIALLFFLYKCFVTTKYGKKALEQVMKEKDQLKREHAQFVNDANEQISELKKENEKLKGYIAHICELSTNQKIKNFGKELEYGEESFDSTTKAD